jgi:c-di-GMP-binding flagellar brake protein YcgR
MARPENLLFRSRLEICRILQMLARERSPVSAEIKNGHPFSSNIVSVDPAGGHFTVAYSSHKTINSMLMDSPSVEFTAADHQGLFFSFEATSPEETLVNGEPVIQFTLPKILLLHNRREHKRLPVPADVSLRCVADEGGFIPFESHITDISHDGLGCLIYDPDINLEPGTILKGCRVVIPNGDAVVADLELRHINSEKQPDGTLVHKAGFRFAQNSDDLKSLVKLFIENWDKQ